MNNSPKARKQKYHQKVIQKPSSDAKSLREEMHQMKFDLNLELDNVKSRLAEIEAIVVTQ